MTMAQVRLQWFEVKRERLPPACMVCGGPAATYKCKRFAWHPPWVYALILVGLIPFAIVALCLTKRMTVWAPLCQEHRSHWLWRMWVVLGGFLGVVAVGMLAFILIAATDQRGRAGRTSDLLAGLACIGTLFLLVVRLAVTISVQLTAIRPTEITDRRITLTGVSEAFLDALDRQDEMREARRREPWRSRDDYSEDMYDPEPPRRRRQPRDEDPQR
jgi:hypothetical protein